jgi:hypothetical protein
MTQITRTRISDTMLYAAFFLCATFVVLTIAGVTGRIEAALPWMGMASFMGALLVDRA